MDKQRFMNQSLLCQWAQTEVREQDRDPGGKKKNREDIQRID